MDLATWQVVHRLANALHISWKNVISLYKGTPRSHHTKKEGN